MNCIFCGKECNGKYHMDCFDSEIEQVYGSNALPTLYMLMAGHDLTHIETECAECTKPRKRDEIFDLIRKGVEEGKRHITRFIIMSNLRRMNFSKEAIEKHVLEFNNNCRPPEDEKIVRYHMKNTFRRWERSGL
jgi:hypothetical protein